LRDCKNLSYDDRFKVANMATFDKFGVMEFDWDFEWDFEIDYWED